ncbi:MAG: sulfatase [Myxococcota bacterium]
MNIRNGQVAGIVVLVLLLTGEVAAAPGLRPNVLFIAIDDLRPELGTYGAPAVTPHIDRLAAEGIRFDRAYTEVAACAASRAGMLTGTYSHTTNVYTMFPPLAEANPELTTMPQVFKDAGYEAIEIGKFLHTVGDAPDAWSRRRWMPPDMKSLNYAVPENRVKSAGSRLRGPLTESVDVPDDAYPDGLRARHAVEELRRLRGRPFFLALGFQRPHLPFTCPEKYWKLYDRDAIEVPDTTDMAGVATPEFHGNYELGAYSGGEDTDPREIIRGYRACVSFIDAQVGLVLRELERLELAESTIVVLWGDHGWHLGEHGIWGKFTALERSLRIPLIMRVPGLTNGESTSGFVETVDILPTLCELTGIELPRQVQGLSFVPLIEQPQRPWKQAVFGTRGSVPKEKRFPLAALTVRTPRYRLVRWVRRGAADVRFTELYDHQTDPREYTNLADRPEHQTRVFLMNSMINAWLRLEPVGRPASD